jgi:hypothetical protein
LLNSSSQHQPRKVITPETAIQYLSARKFDIQKAVDLYEANISTRKREGLYGFDCSVDPLSSELETGKFTVLVSMKEEIKNANKETEAKHLPFLKNVIKLAVTNVAGAVTNSFSTELKRNSTSF